APDRSGRLMSAMRARIDPARSRSELVQHARGPIQSTTNPTIGRCPQGVHRVWAAPALRAAALLPTDQRARQTSVGLCAQARADWENQPELETRASTRRTSSSRYF